MEALGEREVRLRVRGAQGSIEGARGYARPARGADLRAPQAAREGPSAHTMGAREGVGAEGSARSGRARAGSPPAPALALAMRWRNDRRLPGRTRAIFDLTQGGGGLSGGSWKRLQSGHGAGEALICNHGKRRSVGGCSSY